jgi:hypothetical protein
MLYMKLKIGSHREYSMEIPKSEAIFIIKFPHPYHAKESSIRSKTKCASTKITIRFVITFQIQHFTLKYIAFTVWKPEVHNNIISKLNFVLTETILNLEKQYGPEYNAFWYELNSSITYTIPNKAI